MKHSKKLTLIFMTRFIGSVLVLGLFVLYALNGSVFDRALVKSEYVALVHQEILTSVAQTLNAYGLEGSVLDRVLTSDFVRLSIENNLQSLEVIDLRSDVNGTLHDEIERMGISFTHDVEKGMQELTDIVVLNYDHRTRLPLQGTITGVVERIKPWIISLGLSFLILFAVFAFRINHLSIREQNTVYVDCSDLDCIMESCSTYRLKCVCA